MNGEHGLKVLIYPDVALQEKSRKLSLPLSPRDQERLDWMIEWVKKPDALGLSAVQIGWHRRLFVLDLDKLPSGALKGVEVYVNPKAKFNLKGSTNVQEEQCLSCPGISPPVRRALECQMEWTDQNGFSYVRSFYGLHARAVQHELDHLNGLLINRMTMEVFNKAHAQVVRTATLDDILGDDT